MRVSLTLPGESLPATARMVEVGLRFGVPMSVPSRTIAEDVDLELRPGSITLVTGPSGSGKSQVLSEIARSSPTARVVSRVPFPTDVSVLDAVAPTRPVSEALGLLTACGLGEPMLWIRRFDGLSDGEQFRARFARAVGLQRRSGGDGLLICDEFGAILHRRLAKAVAFNLRKLVSRERLRLVVATSQDDLTRDLSPDQTVYMGPDGAELVSRDGGSRRRGAQKISFIRELTIERGAMRDYAKLSSMHYRQRGQVGFVDKVFVLKHRASGTLLGVVVYGHPMLELRLRNRVTGGRFARQPRRLNREMRVLKRLIIHPDVRGCGLGHWLVQRTLPLVKTRFVECLAAMGAINPVFTKAGMARVGTCELSFSQDDSLTKLREAGADPLSAGFVDQVRRRPKIRRIVRAAVQQWHRVSSTAGDARLAKHTSTTLAQTYRQLAGSQPVYFIWAQDKAGWSEIDTSAAQVSEDAA